MTRNMTVVLMVSLMIHLMVQLLAMMLVDWIRILLAKNQLVQEGPLIFARMVHCRDVSNVLK